MLSKLRRSFRYFYKVPWCVPAWGRRELFATLRCIFTGRVINGSYPEAFAGAVTEFLGLGYAVPVNRGRTAIELALRAMGVGKGDEVIFPSYICRSVLDAVVRTGAVPVFADVGPDLQLTVDTVRNAITSKTKCVIVPHLFCKTAPIDNIEIMLRGTGIWLIDDAAQLFGSGCEGRLIGTFGDCGIISCGPGKSLAGAAGGLFVTDNRDLYEEASSIPLSREKQSAVTRRVLSFWIWRRFRKYTLPFQVIINRLLGLKNEMPHEFCTMSNLDAAIALAQFDAMYKNDRIRRFNAETLLQALGHGAESSINDLSRDDMSVKLVLLLPGDGNRLHELIEEFSGLGIECQGGYVPLHKEMEEWPMELTVTEKVWDRVLCIPIDSEFKNIIKLKAFANESFELKR